MIARPQYLPAMECLSFRIEAESQDENDIRLRLQPVKRHSRAAGRL